MLIVLLVIQTFPAVGKTNAKLKNDGILWLWNLLIA